MLVGAKVRLRAIERADIPFFVKWLNDPEVLQFLDLYKPLSTAAEERWFERQLDDAKNTVFAIETAASVHIGNVGLHSIDWKNGNSELGIVIGEKAYWGLGYGTDAINTVLRFAFEEMNLHSVYLRVYEFNERGIRTYAKCGFHEDGRLRERLYRNGGYHDVLLMGVLRQEYDAVGQSDISDNAEPAAAAGRGEAEPGLDALSEPGSES